MLLNIFYAVLVIVLWGEIDNRQLVTISSLLNKFRDCITHFVTKEHISSPHNTFRHHTTHFVTTQHISLPHNTFRYHTTHFVTTQHISSPHNTFRHHKTHFVTTQHISSPQNTFRHHKTHFVTKHHSVFTCECVCKIFFYKKTSLNELDICTKNSPTQGILK